MPLNPDVLKAIQNNDATALEKYLKDQKTYGDINATDDTGNTYLHPALAKLEAKKIIFSNNQILELLLEYKIDTTKKNSQQLTAFNEKNVNVESSGGCSFTCAAAMEGCPKLLAALIAHGGNIYHGYVDPYSYNPLKLAISAYNDKAKSANKLKFAQCIDLLLSEHAGILLPISSTSLSGIGVTNKILLGNTQFSETAITTTGKLVTLYVSRMLDKALLKAVINACEKIRQNLQASNKDDKNQQNVTKLDNYLAALKTALIPANTNLSFNFSLTQQPPTLTPLADPKTGAIEHKPAAPKP